MLTRIYVDNFRCLVNFECHLGAKQLYPRSGNGAGKSTLFDVLGLLRDIVRGEPPMAASWARMRTRWLGVRTQTFELDVSGTVGRSASP